MCAPSATRQADPRGEAGFSLLEAVIAVAILALALGAFFGAGRNALRIASATSSRTAAALETRSLLDRLGTDIPVTGGTFEGKAESGRVYRVTITPLADSHSTLTAYDVVAELRDQREDHAPLIRFETIKLVEPAP